MRAFGRRWPAPRTGAATPRGAPVAGPGGDGTGVAPGGTGAPGAGAVRPQDALRAQRRQPGPGHAGDPAEDPVERRMAALEAGLHGPARARARLLRELRDGLTDTVDALVREGVPADRAAREAVREFGTPEELLPGCQRELTLAQARRTARIVALTAPLFLLACGLLVRAAGHGGPWPQGLPAVLAAAAALPAGAALAATGGLARRWPVPRWLPLAVAWTGRATALGMALAAPALGLAALPSAEGLPLAAAGGLAVVAHAVVAPSARACRRCARLPAALP